MKKILLLSLLVIPTLFGCGNNDTPSKKEDVPEGVVDNSSYVINVPKVNDQEVQNLSSQHYLGKSIYNSNRIKNAVQAKYDGVDRANFIVSNSTMQLTHKLIYKTGDVSSSKVVSSFKNSKGSEYFVNSMDVYARKGEDYVYGRDYDGSVRINTNKLGYYYYEVNVRDYCFTKLGFDVNVEKTFHTYSDQLRTNFRAVSAGKTSIDALGFELKIDKSTIAGIEYSTGEKVYNSLDKDIISEKNIQYVGFHIFNVGVIGIIFPSTSSVSITSNNRIISVKQETLIESKALSATEDVSVNNRIYNDETYNFEGLRAANKIEQTPYNATNFEVDTSRDDAKFTGYDFARGVYTFHLNSNNFYNAFYNEPDKKFIEDITIHAKDDRQVYIYIKTDSSNEGACLIDKNGLQIPIPIELCKNFGHENEEPIYEAGDANYGLFIFPIIVETNKDFNFKLVSVMKNWGNYDVKQLSSISYSIGYYHMSTGVTETNCIAPYFTNNLQTYEDFGFGWFIPDFRGPSGERWYPDPQYNSVGITCIPSNNNTRIKATYQNSDIASSGTIYNDLGYSYVSDDNKYKFNLRHVEMAQNDESRTYYEMDFEMLQDATLKSKDFSFFGFGGRNTIYDKYEYLDDKGEYVSIDASHDIGDTGFYPLNDGSCYLSVYEREDKEVENNNFGLAVKSYSLNGEKNSKLGLAMYTKFDKTASHINTNYVSLTLKRDLALKKGDKIHLELILLPYGDEGKTSENGDNIIKVYNDSVVNPLSVVPIAGEEKADTFVKTIKANDNKSEAVFLGGIDKTAEDSVVYAVKFSDYTKLGKPSIYYKDGANDYGEYKYSKEPLGYDGYQVNYENGKFTYSFNITKSSTNCTYKVEL